MADVFDRNVVTTFDYLSTPERRARCAASDRAPTVLFCAYCGRMQPWLGRRHRYYWSSTTYAQCWPCTIRWAERRGRDVEPRWWRRLARLVSIDWRARWTWSSTEMAVPGWPSKNLLGG